MIRANMVNITIETNIIQTNIMTQQSKVITDQCLINEPTNYTKIIPARNQTVIRNNVAFEEFNTQ